MLKLLERILVSVLICGIRTSVFLEVILLFGSLGVWWVCCIN